MKTETELNEMILRIIDKIKANHPELLKYLNEMPITIPNIENPDITVQVLLSYYDSLTELYHEYEKNHNNNNNTWSDKLKESSISGNVDMVTDISNHSLLTKVNNVYISYTDVGVGLIPIIFLHGFPFDKSTWKGQIDYLKSSNRVIAYDIRGFGKSKDENTPLSIDLFTDDLLAFMDKLDIEKAVICGLSMGGYISLNAVKKFPKRFEALILCDTQCIADTAEVKENRYKTIDQIKLEGAQVFAEKFIKNVFHTDSLTNNLEMVDNLRNIVFANSKAIFASGLVALAERSETCSTLDTIHIPTLIICGREDVVTPLLQSESMHSQIEGSILKIIDHAGHVSNLEQPEQFNKYLVDFLNELNSVSK